MMGELWLHMEVKKDKLRYILSLHAGRRFLCKLLYQVFSVSLRIALPVEKKLLGLYFLNADADPDADSSYYHIYIRFY